MQHMHELLHVNLVCCGLARALKTCRVVAIYRPFFLSAQCMKLRERRFAQELQLSTLLTVLTGGVGSDPDT